MKGFLLKASEMLHLVKISDGNAQASNDFKTFSHFKFDINQVYYSTVLYGQY